MSIYEGNITLRVRFAADNGHDADEALKDIATSIQDDWHDDLPYDMVTGELDEEAIFSDASSIIVGWETGTAER